MWRRSTWTRFVKSNAEVVLGYNDCVAALQSCFWEDAAKLLCIHGAERTSLYASRSIDTPLRYNLEFYECGTCIQHVARLTTDELLAEKWLPRPEFVQARRAPEKQKARIFRILANALRRVFFLFLELLREICKIRVNAIAATFVVAGCLILLVVAYYSKKDFKRSGRRTAETARLAKLADSAYFGFEGDRNFQLAAEYYKKAAEKGDSYSANSLAEMFEEGKGAPADPKEALRWYQVAANEGNATAQYNLGRFYENGIGIPVDQKQAMKWYREAASRGNGCADFTLGRLYELGIGVPQDSKLAMFYYQNARSRGYMKCGPSPVLGSRQGPNRSSYDFSSAEGGFTFSAVIGVRVKEELIPASSGQMREVVDSVDMGAAGLYKAATRFFPVSVGNREDADKEFNNFKSTYSSACAAVRYEKTTAQGLPAQVIQGTKCRNPPRTKWLGLWVFAGNRIFTFDYFVPSQSAEDSRRLLASFKIEDPRFVNRGEWLVFPSEFGGFSVSLAGFPLHQAVSVRGGAIYSLENYAFSARSIPAVSGKPDEILDGVEKITQASVHGTATGKTDLVRGGLPARRFSINYQTATGNFMGSNLALIGKERVYLLSVSSSEDRPISEDDIERFFNSFKEIKIKR